MTNTREGVLVRSIRLVRSLGSQSKAWTKAAWAVLGIKVKVPF